VAGPGSQLGASGCGLPSFIPSGAAQPAPFRGPVVAYRVRERFLRFGSQSRFSFTTRTATRKPTAHAVTTWQLGIGGKRHEWDAEITHQEPDRRIAWRAEDGKYNSGNVTFEPIGSDRTRINVEMTYDTEGLVESLGSALGADDRRVKGDLKRFKELIESRGVESGAWRGEVHKGEVTSR